MGLNGYIFSTNNTGSWQNDTFESFSTTFGKTNIGGSSSIIYNFWTKKASRFQASANGNITSISAYLAAFSASQDFYAGIYNDSNGAPGSLLGESSSTEVGTSAAWYNFTFSSPIPVTANSYYWLAVLDSGRNYYIYYDSGNTNQYAYLENGDVPPMDDPFGTPTDYEDWNMSIYATYSTHTQAWSNVTKTLNSTVGARVEWCVYANDTSDNWNASEMFSLTTTDGTPPEWSDNKTSPTSPTTYSPNQDYQFNVTWDDGTGVSIVLIEQNFTTKTPTLENVTVTDYRTISGNKREYYFNISDLPAGTYVWREYANDTTATSYWGVTDTWIYTVNKAPTLMNLYLNGTDDDKVYHSNESVNITADLNMSFDIEIWTNFTGAYALWDSGPDPLMNHTDMDYGLGSFNVTGNFSGNQNYSASYDSHLLTVWGWSNLSWVSPDNGDYVIGNIITLNCSVFDANTSSPIQDYPVKFYNETDTGSSLLGTNTTDSSGHAIYRWNTSDTAEGTYYPKCNITDNSTLYYNVSVGEDNTTITLSLNQPPNIWNLVVRNFYTDEPITETATGAKINITVNVSDPNNNIDYVEANFTWPNGTIVYANLTSIEGKNYTHVWNYSLPYEMPNGTAIINVTTYDSFGYANSTNTTLTILENIEIVLENQPINFTSVYPGIEVNATTYQGWPLNVIVLGNVPVNLTQKGEHMTGKVNPSVDIKVENITWNQTDLGLFSGLTTDYVLINESKQHGEQQYIYYKLKVPVIEPQPYGGNVYIKGQQT